MPPRPHSPHRAHSGGTGRATGPTADGSAAAGATPAPAGRKLSKPRGALPAGRGTTLPCERGPC
eukprot:6500759-Lingulodinium_polyedra.AAC.1